MRMNNSKTSCIAAMHRGTVPNIHACLTELTKGVFSFTVPWLTMVCTCTVGATLCILRLCDICKDIGFVALLYQGSSLPGRSWAPPKCVQAVRLPGTPSWHASPPASAHTHPCQWPICSHLLIAWSQSTCSWHVKLHLVCNLECLL